MKKILMLTHHDISVNDGATTRVKVIAHLLEDSFDVECFGLAYTSLLSLPFCLLKMINKIIKTDWDYVYVYSQEYMVVILYLMKKLKGYKLIWDTLLSWELQGDGKFRAFEEKYVGKLADYIIVVSELSHVFYKNSILIPTLVDTDKFKMDNEKRNKIRKELGISDNIVVGLIGSFYSEYNKPSLKYLYENLDKFDKRIKFMLIGEMNERIGDLIYTGYVQDYIGYLSSLDALLVYRSVPTDGAINRIVEAMSMGIPVFANPIAGRSMESQAKDIFVFEDYELPSKINEVMLKGNVQGNRNIAEEYYSENKYKKILVEGLTSY